MKTYVLILLSLIVFSGCASLSNDLLKTSNQNTVKINEIYSKSLNTKLVKNIVLIDLLNDDVDFSLALDSSLNNIYINNEKYFNID